MAPTVEKMDIEQETEIRNAQGTVVSLGNDGLGLIQRDEGANDIYMFTFDKIPGYRGENLDGIARQGIRCGARVQFDAVERNVSHLEPVMLR